ncbi:MAG TPA: carboxypeptidase-like regulatory domain-containing protein [Bryobacteraceae bacterium]|jgi:hypothetical protein|nr:carboxypeptidase-like regulatory domain-containing protein [Bryobacteraceae bacterium]
MRIALAILLLPFSGRAASLTGTVVDANGAYIARAPVELDSGTKKYQVQGDDEGVYKFSELPAGEYTLTFRVLGFQARTVKSIVLSEAEHKPMPDVPLEVVSVDCHGPIRRDIHLLPLGAAFGQLSGSVRPAAPGVEVFLICRTFHACGSTKTDPDGRFSFDMLSAGVYGLSFHRDGFYDQDATGYEYYVNAGWDSVYASVTLEPCADGNCKAKIQRILPHCE